MRDVILFLLGLAFAALGVVNPATAPLWVGIAIVVIAVAVVGRLRGRIGRLLVSMGIKAGGPANIAPYRPAPEAQRAERSEAFRTARIIEERRVAVRMVRDAISEAMVMAEDDREHGSVDERATAVAAANRGSATVKEVDNIEARRLVAEWKAMFDAIEKGWKDGGLVDFYTNERKPLGYPEPAWTDLRNAAEAALDQLGSVIRKLMDSSDASPTMHHAMSAVGRHITCTCGQQFDNGPAFNAHLRSEA